MMRTLVLLVATVTGHAATIPAVDSTRGEKVFQTQGCANCHSVSGTGGKSASDLGRSLDRNFTPALLVSTMWNHAPVMWSAMRESGASIPKLSEQDAADLFAFFYASRYFDRSGDAARGKRVFAEKHCADCHGATTPGPGGATPVTKWESLDSSIALAEGMWNHSGQMKEQMASRNLPWQQLTAQEIADILVYARSFRRRKMSFEMGSGDRGAEIFEAKGCGSCHKEQLALESRLKEKTVAEIAAAMWNHVPQMSPGKLQQFEPGEMGQLLNYLWARQYFSGAGNADRGAKTFAAKGCASCHGDASSGAPDLSKLKGKFSYISMVSALWKHGPTMLGRMNQRAISWPRFDGREMSNIIAYLNR